MSSSTTYKNAFIEARVRNDRVTGSSIEFIVSSNGVKKVYMVDKGLFLGCGEAEQNFTDETYENYDALFLTHAHIDHCGQIPHMCKSYDGPIYMSRQTSQVSQALINDEFFVLSQQGIQITKDDKRGYRKMINQTEIVKAYENIGMSNAVFTMLNNAHVLGSNMVYFKTKEAKKNFHILVSGDYREHHPFLKNNGIKNYLKRNPVDVLFLESTYGASDLHPDIHFAVEQMKTAILETIEAGGDVLIPVFSFDRTQSILYYLTQLQNENHSFSKIPIFLDGKLAQYITSVYKQEIKVLGGDSIVITPRNFHEVIGKQEREEVFKVRGKIVLASSGQMHAGAIVPYMQEMSGDEKNALIVVGYVGHKVGRNLIEAEQGTSVDYAGKSIIMNMKRYNLHGFSAHADKAQLASFVEYTRKHNEELKLVLYHGETEAKAEFKQYLVENGIMPEEDIFIPNSSQRILINKCTMNANELLFDSETE